MMELEQ